MSEAKQDGATVHVVSDDGELLDADALARADLRVARRAMAGFAASEGAAVPPALACAVAGAVAGADSPGETAGPMPVAKASGQEPGLDGAPASGRGAGWVEPRISTDALLQFLDWNTWHRRCCIVKSQIVAGLGWTLERDGVTVWDTATEEGDAEDPAVRLLLSPSPDEPSLGADGLLYRVLLDYHATGDGYIEVVRDGAGRVAELYHVASRRMRRGADGVTYYQTTSSGVPRRFDAFRRKRLGASKTEVLHLREYDPQSEAYGMPGWVGALAAMGLDRTVLEFNTRLFQNSMMAQMAVVVEGGKLSEAGREALKSFIKQRAVGVENAGRVLLIEDENDRVKIRFEKLNVEVKDLMLTGIQQHFRDVVVGAHGVPPRILGIVTTGQLGATGEVEGQLRTFREIVIRPLQRTVEGLLSSVLDATLDAGDGGPDGRPSVRYRLRFADLDATGQEADAALLDVLFKHGVYAGADARALAERVVLGGTG